MLSGEEISMDTPLNKKRERKKTLKARMIFAESNNRSKAILTKKLLPTMIIYASLVRFSDSV